MGAGGLTTGGGTVARQPAIGRAHEELANAIEHVESLCKQAEARFCSCLTAATPEGMNIKEPPPSIGAVPLAAQLNDLALRVRRIGQHLENLCGRCEL